MDDKRKEFYALALKEWGEDAQLRMCIEEMSELTKEICKYTRLLKSGNSQEILSKLEQTKQNLKDEIADVLNMAEQLEFLFGEEEIEKIRNQKISRELERLKDWKEKNK